MFRKNNKMMEGMKVTLMKSILNMKHMPVQKHKVSTSKNKWTMKSISEISDIEDQFVNHTRMNFNFFSRELIYYTCEFCLLRCIFHHKFTKKFQVALKYLEKAI